MRWVAPTEKDTANEKCDALFEHVYESYAGERQRVFNQWRANP